MEFENLSNIAAGLTDENLLNLFISGLKPDNQSEVQVRDPQTLTYALALAKMFEAKLLNPRPSFPRPFPTTLLQNTNKQSFPLPPRTQTQALALPPPKTPPKPTTFPIKRLTPAEIQARRAKGLCYNCDELFKPGHQCRTKPFLLLQVDEEQSGELLTAELPPPLSSYPPLQPPSDVIEIELDEFQVSLHALYGDSSHHCLRMTGVIQGHSFTVLIDSGNIHNLIQPRVAEFLSLLVQPAPRLSLVISNGDTIRCQTKNTRGQGGLAKS